MNTSPSSTAVDFCLDETVFRRYAEGKLSAAEQHGIEVHLNECTLCASAMTGFVAHPDALNDVSGIRNEIAQRSGMSSFSLTSKLIMGTAFLAAAALVVVLAWPKAEVKKEQPLVGPETNTVLPNQTAENTAAPARDEHFINPQAPAPRPKPAAVVVDEDSAAVQLPEWVQPLDAKPPQPLLPEEVQQGKPQPEYNAAFVYILDLKITGFDTYYRKNIVVDDLPLRGVPAQFGNEEEIEKGDDETKRSVPADRVLREALQSFNEGRYGRCISKCDLLLKSNAKDVNALFYAGVSYVRLEMPDKAIPYLDRVLAETNNVFHEEALWYKAIALNNAGDREGSMKLFKQIASQPGYYQAKAKEKLK
ncbi:MAG: tetratricopeptide repeat protein [Bacteroidia bacterium]